MRFLSLLIIAAINFALIVNHDTMAADNFAIEFDGDNQKRVQNREELVDIISSQTKKYSKNDRK